MRKLRSGTGSASNASGASSQGIAEGTDAASAQHNQLGLMHLKKLFNEYTHPKEPLSEIERDFKLYNMLPLFCKVWILQCAVQCRRSICENKPSLCNLIVF